MKSFISNRRALLPAALALQMSFPLHAEQTSALVGPRPVKAGDQRIVRSNGEGYLRVYTPEIPIYDEDGLVGWENDNYRIVPESGGSALIWFHRRPLGLKPGLYDVEVVYPKSDVVEPRDQNNYGKVRVSIKAGRISDVWLNDSDRPKFTEPTSSALVRDGFGDVIGYRNR